MESKVFVCKFCSSSVELENSRPLDGGRVCMSCKWKAAPKCGIKGCTTPRRKETCLKSIPTRFNELASAARVQLSLDFGLTKEIVKCCSSCFLKLHRAAANVHKQFGTAPTAHTESPTESASCIPRTGRPSIPYETASTRTKQNIEKKAKKATRKYRK